ncbi:unnamed protein product [Allacma fusca]|uniref:Uncharacterized protein n=1 Tax=Allacma fusca TaxID=39272 RepID=A0A8J2P8S3_9HEXA|nr:unnamed protein product [Allacma fusca]
MVLLIFLRYKDKDSVHPKTIKRRQASSASESEGYLTDFHTYADESELEFQNTDTVWAVQWKSSSQGASYNLVRKYQVDEPVFILTPGSSDEIVPTKTQMQKHKREPCTDGTIQDYII